MSAANTRIAHPIHGERSVVIIAAPIYNGSHSLPLQSRPIASFKSEFRPCVLVGAVVCEPSH
jgi:hypothetical protein